MEKHPEQRENEVFIGNFLTHDFLNSEYKTKRFGDTAYDNQGRLVKSELKILPVFVDRDEYEEIQEKYKED